MNLTMAISFVLWFWWNVSCWNTCNVHISLLLYNDRNHLNLFLQCSPDLGPTSSQSFYQVVPESLHGSHMVSIIIDDVFTVLAISLVCLAWCFFLKYGNHPSTGWRTSAFRMEERENPSAWRALCTTSIIFGWSLESSESSNMSNSSRSAWFVYWDIYLGEQIQMRVKA